jgi:hypothetical protein
MERTPLRQKFAIPAETKAAERAVQRGVFRVNGCLWGGA